MFKDKSLKKEKIYNQAILTHKNGKYQIFNWRLNWEEENSVMCT